MREVCNLCLIQWNVCLINDQSGSCLRWLRLLPPPPPPPDCGSRQDHERSVGGLRIWSGRLVGAFNLQNYFAWVKERNLVRHQTGARIDLSESEGPGPSGSTPAPLGPVPVIRASRGGHLRDQRHPITLCGQRIDRVRTGRATG